MKLVLALTLAASGCGGTPRPTTPASTTPSATPTAAPVTASPDAPLGPAGTSVAITSPANDTMQLDRALTVKGTVAPPGSGVTVQLGATSVTAQVTGGTWEATLDLPTIAGTSVVEARTGTAHDEVLVTHGADVARRATQKVRFVWHDGVDDQLRQIARGTLQSPSAAKVEAFVAGVHGLAPAVLLRAYEGFDVADASDDSADVHTVDLLPGSDDFFGQSLYDCGNLQLHQQSDIMVGTYRSTMVDEFPSWGPMQKSDSLQVRIEDVADALGRTCAHELGHSLGFVGSELGSPCGWMMGCDGGHNCSELAATFARAERFGSGRFIMDPGNKTLNHFRLAEASAGGRGQRTPSVFTAFDRSYLAAIHPRP